MNREIVVHSLDHALAALATAKSLALPVTLASAPGAATQAGPGWFKALIDAAHAAHPDVAVTAILDCGVEPGAVMAALRAGLSQLRFDGDDAWRQKLAAMGARFVEPAAAVLDLCDAANPTAACAAFLGRR